MGNPAAPAVKLMVWCIARPHEDKTPSLSVSESNGKILVKCHAGCSQTAVIEALRGRGIWPPSNSDWPKVQTGFIPREANSSLTIISTRWRRAGQFSKFAVIRRTRGKLSATKAGPKKSRKVDLAQRRHFSLIPYRLPHVLQGKTVFVVEGEKDVASLNAWV